MDNLFAYRGMLIGGAICFLICVGICAYVANRKGRRGPERARRRRQEKIEIARRLIERL
jgi:hypothetical protein